MPFSENRFEKKAKLKKVLLRDFSNSRDLMSEGIFYYKIQSGQKLKKLMFQWKQFDESKAHFWGEEFGHKILVDSTIAFQFGIGKCLKTVKLFWHM